MDGHGIAAVEVVGMTLVSSGEVERWRETARLTANPAAADMRGA